MRARSMLPAEGAREFLSFRACLRTLLTMHYLKGLSPAKIQIEISAAGKPWLPEHSAVKFNLSHSQGALAIAISRHEVGIDIEKIRPMPDWRELAEGVLPSTEIAEIASHDVADLGEAFLRRFTAREAYLKAIGTGFSAAPPAMDFHSRFSADAAANGGRYQLAQLPAITNFVGHVCLASF